MSWRESPRSNRPQTPKGLLRLDFEFAWRTPTRGSGDAGERSAELRGHIGIMFRFWGGGTGSGPPPRMVPAGARGEFWAELDGTMRSNRRFRWDRSWPGVRNASKGRSQILDLPGRLRWLSRKSDPRLVAGVELAGSETLIAVPLLRSGETRLIGSLASKRQAVRPFFPTKQIAPLQISLRKAVVA